MSYVTVPMQPAHRDAVVRLWSENLPAPQQQQNQCERSAWAYDDKPDGAARTVVALDEESGEPVGCGSVYPRSVTACGSRLLAGVLADFAVSRSHRSGAAALLIQRALVRGTGAEPELSFMYGLPNEAALPVFRRVGYKAIGRVRSWVKPLRAAYKLREYVPGASIARVAAFPVDSFLSAADERRARRFKPVESCVVDRADHRFDALWARGCANYRLTGERTAAYLNWRYATRSSRPRRFFCVHEPRTSDLLGYVAFSTHGNKVVVNDLFAVDPEQAAERVLLQFTSGMRRDGCDSVFVVYFGDPRLDQCFSRTGFLARSTPERSVVVLPRALSDEQARAITCPDMWCLFDGEMDF
jgi:hypothetical protein